MKRLLLIPLFLLVAGCDLQKDPNYQKFVSFNQLKIAECRAMGGYAQTELAVYGNELNFAYYEKLKRCWFPTDKQS